MRDWLTGLAILVIVALCAAIAAPFVIDWDHWRGEVERRASTAIGKPVKIEGPLSLRLLPSPVLRAGEFRIGGAEDHASARVAKAKLELSLTALLRGEFRITDATMDNPVLTIRAGKSGDGNADSIPPLRDMPLAAIEQLQITDGMIEHIAADGKITRPFSGNFSVEAVSLRGPWKLAGRAVAEERSYDVRLATGVLDDAGRLPLKLSIADAGLAFVADLDGAAIMDGNNRGALPRIEGRVAASGTFPWPLGKQAGLQPWRLQAQGASTAKGFTAQQIEIEAGPQETALRASGDGRLDIAEGLAATLSLKARPLDFDKMRANDDAARSPSKDDDMVALMERALVATPFPVALAVEGDTIIVNGESAGPYKLETRLTRGRMTIDNFSTTLPGQARLGVSGMAALASMPQFDGTIRLSAGNPGKTWSWLTQAPAETAATPRFARLRDMNGEFPVTVTPATMTASNFRLNADGGTINGEARYRFPVKSNRARLDATIMADRLDLDLFPSAQGGGGALDFSVNIDAKAITARSINAQSLGALSLTARSDESGLNIERFELRGSDTARLFGSGRIGTNGGRIDTRIDARDVSPLLIAAQRLFPALNLGAAVQRAATFNPAAVAITLERGRASDDFSATIVGTLASTAIDANLGGTARKRPNDSWDTSLDNGRLMLKSQDFAQFLNQLGAGLNIPSTQLKIPATVTLKSGAPFVRGTGADRRQDWIFEGDIGGIAFSAGGISTEGHVPTGNGPFSLASADASALLRLLGIMEPMPNLKIPLDVKGTAEFGLGGLRAQTMRGTIGALQLDNGMMHWPFLPDAKLRGQFAFTQFSIGDLAGFLLGPDAAAGTGLWPSGRFSAARKPLVDFDVEVQAKTFPLGALPAATNASMRIATLPGGIQMPGFGADFAGGRLGFHMTFRSEGTLASASGRIEATGTDPATFGLQALSGRFDTLIDVTGVGETATQMIQSLGGAGSITTRGMRIAALDPLSATRARGQWQGKDPPNSAALAATIEQELPKAAWAAGNMTLPLTLTRGAARIGPAQHEINNAQATGQALIDLRDGMLNANLTLTQRSGDEPSEFTVRWNGPLASPKRAIDTTLLQNQLQLAAIAREQERLSILEQDARERAAFNRRLRAERDMRERETVRQREAEDLQRRADSERRAAEEAIQRAAQERKILEDMARRASEGAPAAPSAPLQVTPR